MSILFILIFPKSILKTFIPSLTFKNIFAHFYNRGFIQTVRGHENGSFKIIIYFSLQKCGPKVARNVIEVNFTNNLRAALAPILLCQKIQRLK